MFSTVLSGSEKQKVYMATGCSAWVWSCKGDISSQGHLDALLDALSGPLCPFHPFRPRFLKGLGVAYSCYSEYMSLG